MKTVKLLLLIPVLSLLSFNVTSPGLSDSERKMALDQLKETKEALLKTVKGLSAAQLTFKASPESWSVADCVEHLAKSESMLWGMVEGVPAAEGDDVKPSMSDEALLGMITDRTNKIKTQEPFEPTNAFGSHEGALKEFTSKRDAHIAYVKSTTADLRSQFSDLPFGKIDSYQAILFMAGHTKRHTMQAKEVMANAKFPKK